MVDVGDKGACVFGESAREMGQRHTGIERRLDGVGSSRSL